MAEHELQRGHALVHSVRASRLLADAVEHLRCILLHVYIHSYYMLDRCNIDVNQTYNNAYHTTYICSKALTVRPLHPEAHGLMAEILGLAGTIS